MLTVVSARSPCSSLKKQRDKLKSLCHGGVTRIRPDVIVVDPSRKGCDQELLKAMLDMEPERIVYVSCNPSTLARDLRILEDGGYETKEVIRIQ
ncbi:tRNA (Uracil-5-)-methyltransferase [Halobacillus aidingensis]|uniref:tRNA (Uracil-5-)-methyltransferase n=1 Tax=Halobacillus aidingensis TaxID=240303 RepID=A0A1H0IFQ5_HALAD|nr:tRNA (Uracil-5-)-methyltransferase [Halobacillus aidingensis]